MFGKKFLMSLVLLAKGKAEMHSTNIKGTYSLDINRKFDPFATLLTV